MSETLHHTTVRPRRDSSATGQLVEDLSRWGFFAGLGAGEAADMRAWCAPLAEAGRVLPLRVGETRRSGDRYARITLTGPGLAGFRAGGPDQRGWLFLPRDGQRAPLLPEGTNWRREWRALPADLRPIARVFTIVSARAGAIDLEILLHGQGPAARWAAGATAGDQVGFLPSLAEFAPARRCDSVVLIGDESALPAISAIVADLAPQLPVTVLAEVDAVTAPPAFTDLPGVTARLICRSPGALPRLVRATDLPGGRPYLWVAGESSDVQAIRRHLLRDRRYPPDAATFMSYWRRGHTA